MDKLKNKLIKLYKYGDYIQNHLDEIKNLFNKEKKVVTVIKSNKITLDFENDKIIYGDIPEIPKMTAEDHIRYNNLPKIPLVKNQKFLPRVFVIKLLKIKRNIVSNIWILNIIILHLSLDHILILLR
jgi:hypothetical protein